MSHHTALPTAIKAALTAMLLVLLLPLSHAIPTASAPFLIQAKAVNGDKTTFNKLYLTLTATGPESNFVIGVKKASDAYGFQYNASTTTITTQEVPGGEFPESLDLLRFRPQNTTGVPDGYKSVGFQLGLDTPGFAKNGGAGTPITFKNSKYANFASFALCHLKYHEGFSHGQGPTLLWRPMSAAIASNCSDIKLIQEKNTN